MCSPGKFAHFPVEDFDRKKLFLIGPGLSTNETEFTHSHEDNRQKKRQDENTDDTTSPMLGDIMFTQLQAKYLSTQGITVPSESVDTDFRTKRLKKHGYTENNLKDAALFTNLWTDNFDNNTDIYSVPYFFHGSFLSSNPIVAAKREIVRQGLRQIENVTCIKFVEISNTQVSQWSHSIGVYYTSTSQTCRSYIGQVKLFWS